MFTFTLNLYSQNWMPSYQEVSYKLYELTINDSTFLNSLDSLIFAKKCPDIVNRTYKYFIMKIDKNSDTVYPIRIEAYKKPLANPDAIGYFTYNSYFFFIYGCNPNNIFQKTTRRKCFKYTDQELPYVEDFPYWKLDFSNARLSLEEFDCW